MDMGTPSVAKSGSTVEEERAVQARDHLFGWWHIFLPFVVPHCDRHSQKCLHQLETHQGSVFVYLSFCAPLAGRVQRPATIQQRPIVPRHVQLQQRWLVCYTRRVLSHVSEDTTYLVALEVHQDKDLSDLLHRYGVPSQLGVLHHLVKLVWLNGKRPADVLAGRDTVEVEDSQQGLVERRKGLFHLPVVAMKMRLL